MNKIYKTVWNAVRQQFVVADEAQNTHGKPAKAAVALTVAAAALCSTMASAAYVEPGFVANSRLQLADAIASWETAEYKADWGLGAMHASTAYALGFNGKGVAVGVMDSGALLEKHPDLKGDRFHASEADSKYGSTGNRYPQDAKNPGKYSPDKPATSTGKIDGNWISGTNDSHGTHVTGTVGANRDGSEFHGVAWGADVWVGNTGGTDNTNYGPFQDYTFFYNGWKALADNLVRENGEKRGGFINNSFGTNTRIVDNGTKGPDGGSTGVHFPTDTVSQTEYEYFLFNQMYGTTYDSTTGEVKSNGSFVDGAWDAIKDTKVVQIFTTGNRDFANPFYRPLYPYFNPAAENQWIAVAGLKKGSENGSYQLYDTFNEAGLAKWWTVTAPGQNIYGSKVDTTTGEALWGNSSGTSMAAPHVAGAMAVLMSRYENMSAPQVRDVMFTTANHKNEDGSNYHEWTAAEGEVDIRYGWGTPDLAKGMYGPGQFLGTFTYNMDSTTATLDVWSNNIGHQALEQREREDLAWKTAADKWMKNPTLAMDGLNAEEKALLGEILLDTPDDVVGVTAEQEKISEADAIAWRKAYYQKRIDAIQKKIDGNLYKGSLIKQGEGTLVMTGTNTYTGTTTVTGGTLLAFKESIGADNTVTVQKGATFGVLGSYNDTFTQTGYKSSAAAADDKLDIVFKDGGTLYIDAGSDVTVSSITGTVDGITVGMQSLDADKKIALYHAGKARAAEGTLTGSLKVTGESALGGKTPALGTVDASSPFFKATASNPTVSADGKTVTVSLSSEKAASFADFATGGNTGSIARALEASTSGYAGVVLGMSDEKQIKQVYQDLDDDFYASARNGLVMNSLAVSRTVIDQARGMGEGRAVEMENGMGRIWATGIGHWGTSDGSKFDTDVDFRAGFIGGEFVAHETTKVGAYFGYGSSDYKANANKIDADNVHFGVYGMSDVGPASITYGFAYTTEDRDTERSLGGFMSAHSEDASVMQLFAEAAYTGFDLGENKVQPYLGLAWAKVKTDSVSDQYDQSTMTTDEIDDNIGIASVGVRAALPFTMGTMPVAVKADAGYSHFFGDTEGVTRLQLGKNGGWAEIEGSELKGLFNVGLGVTAQVAKSATVGINYGASLGSDQKTHGINATLRIAF